MSFSSLNEEDIDSLRRRGVLDDICLQRLYQKKPGLQLFTSVAFRWVLSLSITFFLSGLIFFFAWNWDEMGKWEKFGSIGIGILLMSLGSLLTRAKHQLMSDLFAVAASVLVGVFLAVFGQIYQTGADAWNLFFGWALLILPWVMVSRFQSQWLIWVGLLELSLWLAYRDGSFGWLYSVRQEGFTFLLLAVLPVVMIVLRKTALRFYGDRSAWLRSNYGHWILQTGALCAFTYASIFSVWDNRSHGAWAIPIVLLHINYLGWLYLGDWKRDRKLFELGLGTFSLCVTVVALIGRAVREVDNGEAAFLMMFLIVFGVFGGAGAWLREEMRRENKEALGEAFS